MSPVNVLVVDDSVVIRHLVSTALQADPDVTVIGTASNGQIALERAAALQPDLITMDVEMPIMDGISAVRALRSRGFRQPIIMCSTLTTRGAAATLEALVAGASDYIAKPSNGADRDSVLAELSGILLAKVRALTAKARPAPAAAPAAPPALRPTPRGPARRPSAVVIGSSTGGPQALATVLGALPALPVPVLIVQHMPPLFTTQLAARLDRLSPAHVQEAAGAHTLRAGDVWIAPGDQHLTVTPAAGGAQTRLVASAPRNFCRPSVDVLFESAHEVYGPGLLAVVLTGMGADGRDGATVIHQAGGTVIAQDEATSVVWGMPGAVTAANVADHVSPIEQIPALITRIVMGTP